MLILSALLGQGTRNQPLGEHIKSPEMLEPYSPPPSLLYEKPQFCTFSRFRRVMLGHRKVSTPFSFLAAPGVQTVFNGLIFIWLGVKLCLLFTILSMCKYQRVKFACMSLFLSPLLHRSPTDVCTHISSLSVVSSFYLMPQVSFFYHYFSV